MERAHFRHRTAGNVSARLTVCALLAAAVALLGACATTPPMSSPTVAAEMVALVASADAGTVARRCTVPFLFDGEILNRRQDVDYLWASLREHGFLAEASRVSQIVPVSVESYRRFADTTEVGFFFQRHVSADGVLVAAAGFPAPVLLLVVPDEHGEARIAGIRVGER
jgi:dienelactone hydrolase